MKEHKYSGLIICGDFNTPKIDWHLGSFGSCQTEGDTFENNLLECLNDCFFHQNVYEPTFQMANETPKSILDLVITEDSVRIYNIEYGPPLGETNKGHFTLKWEYDLKPIEKEDSCFKNTAYNFTKGDYSSFSNYLKGIN